MRLSFKSSEKSEGKKGLLESSLIAVAWSNVSVERRHCSGTESSSRKGSFISHSFLYNFLIFE